MQWIILCSDMLGGVPVEIIGPYADRKEADKTAKRIKIRARQLDKIDIANGVTVRLMYQHEGNLDELINKI